MTKYRAQPITIDGHRFPSLKEGARYRELLLLVRAGEISDLVLQPEFKFVLDGKKMFTYFSDFGYTEKDGTKVVEDTKGYKTDVYKIKKKIIEHVYGIKIKET